MSYTELRTIDKEIKAAKSYLEALETRRATVSREYHEMREMENDRDVKGNVSAEEINYVLGQSDGFLSGFDAAISTIIEAMASQYRDIPMTEDEMYMLVELGDRRRMARMKDAKSTRLANKAGWKRNNDAFIPYWVKKKEEVTE